MLKLFQETYSTDVWEEEAMIPLYTLNLFTFGQPQERRVGRDVAAVCGIGWLAYLVFALLMFSH